MIYLRNHNVILLSYFVPITVTLSSAAFRRKSPKKKKVCHCDQAESHKSLRCCIVLGLLLFCFHRLKLSQQSLKIQLSVVYQDKHVEHLVWVKTCNREKAITKHSQWYKKADIDSHNSRLVVVFSFRFWSVWKVDRGHSKRCL